ncbi:MAG: 50S ribosomal protein L11 methyltransferase [Desulfotomaculum sp.]|nr:50S ribosomal protein L11 methyltransferase [Desulfotomaculum sp.]
MKWLEVAVRIPADGVEMISLIFEELGSGGVAIDDPALIYNKMQSGEWDACEFPEIQCKREMPLVTAYFPLDEKTSELLQELKRRIKKLGYHPDIVTREKREEDWANAWQAYYKPFTVGKKFFIKPVWEEAKLEHNRITLNLDPGMAFGCGTHPTTSMCLEIVENTITGGEEVYDVGTGSGILAIAAAKLGAKRVVAVDLDRTAVKVARNNVKLNAVGEIVRVQHGDLLSNHSGKADIVIANIVADVIIKLAPDAYQILNAGGRFITSGIINTREEDVLTVLKREGFALKERKINGDWRAFLLQKE